MTSERIEPCPLLVRQPEENGLYSRLRQLATAGKWPEALALMRANDLSKMKRAFRTTCSGEGRYEMIFRFDSLDELHLADFEWREFRSATGR